MKYCRRFQPGSLIICVLWPSAWRDSQPSSLGESSVTLIPKRESAKEWYLSCRYSNRTFMVGRVRHSEKPLKPHGDGLPPELVREAALDQVTRLTRGAYVLPIILVAIWGTTTYVNDRPRLFWFSAVAMLLATAIRLVVSGMRERTYNTHPTFLAWIGVFTVGISSGASGLV